MPQSLLVPVADETQAEVVCEYLTATYDDVDVTLLHVIEYTEKKTNPSRGGRDRPEGWYDRERTEAEDLFESVRGRLQALGDVETAIEAGDPSAEIVEYAHSHGADQVVIGLRKRSPTGKLVFGSTAQDILLSSRVPVVCVPLTES
ncbi:universal stress protein [Natronomonas sp. EA1]|uniref:universal stress protein n=1 Tax=Natronomonas sp. EA1 TaxID=3421655 RepID=UPI003EB96076